MKKAKVAVLRTRPESVIDDYIRLCELADIRKHLNPEKTTIIKDNISWHYLYPGSNTTPWQMEGVILALKKNGFNDIVDVHNNTVVTNPYKGRKLNKFDRVLEKYNIPELYNFKKEDMKWVRYEPRHKTLALHKVFPEGIYLPDFFFDKNIVHLPTVKTHSYTTYTGALKNAFGGLLNTRRHYTHTWIHDTLVDLLAIQKEIHSGLFAVMDGTVAGSGPGPRTLIPYDKNVILASGDMVAIDAVAAKLMGFDPMSIPCIYKSHQLGLGTGDISEIEIVGDKDVMNENWHFSVGVNLATGAGRLFWFSPLRIFQKLFFHTPIVYIFVFASAFYHDFIWYPINGRKVVRKWLKESPWGRLFDEY